MAITITKTGSEISTEKYVVTATSSDPLVTAVQMVLHINGTQIDQILQHLPDFGTTDTFSFEINSIIKDYFASEFLPLTGVNQTTIENVLVGVEFNEVIGTAIGGASFRDFVVIKNMTQDTFEIEDFDLADYDCGDTGSDSSKFLTSAPNPLPIGDATSVHLSCLTTSYTALAPNQEWVIQTLLDGVLVNTVTEPVEVPTRGITGYVTDGKYDISAYRFDFNSADGYNEVRFYIRDIASPFTIRSEQRVYKLNDACEKSITLSWLNEFGVQDTFTFLGNFTRTGKYTDSTYKKVRPVNPVSTDVGDLVYKSSYNYQYDIFSDRMPEESVQWLSNILVNKRAAIQGQAVLASGALELSGVTYHGSMPEDLSYLNLVDGGNGFAYGAPARSGNFIKYELATDTITTIPSPYTAGVAPYYTYGILSPSTGKIYYMNDISNADNVLVFDPVLETFTTFGSGTFTGQIGKPSVTPSGIIYANINSGNSKFYKIDTNLETVTEIVSGVTSGGGASVYDNGFVYFIPSGGATEFYKLNTTNDNIATIAAPTLTEGASSSTLSDNGKIYSTVIDFMINKVFVIDTVDDSSYLLDTGVTLNGAYAGIFAMPNDNVYLLGEEQKDILKLDTLTDLFSVETTISTDTFQEVTVIGNNAYSISIYQNEPVIKISFEYENSAKDGKYFPITITTEDTVLEDKFTPETLFRLKFRLANKRKGLK